MRRVRFNHKTLKLHAQEAVVIGYKRKTPEAVSRSWIGLVLSTLVIVLMLNLPVAAATGSFGYALHTPVALSASDVYYISGHTVYSFSPAANEATPLFSLLDNEQVSETLHPLIYADGGYLWAVVRDAESEAVRLRRYAPPSASVTTEYTLQAWPDHGAFVNGRFYYVGVDPDVSIQATLFALDLNSGTSYVADSRSLLRFDRVGDYLYYAPYELSGGNAPNSVAFASDPPYPVTRFNTASGQIETLPVGVGFPDVLSIGNYLITLNAGSGFTMHLTAYDVAGGDPVTVADLTSNVYPVMLSNGTHLIVQTVSSGTMTIHVFDAALRKVNTLDAPYMDGRVPVAMDGRYVYLAVDTAAPAHADASGLTAILYLE